MRKLVMMNKKQEQEVVTFYASSREEWRAWLEANHEVAQPVWLIQYRKGSNVPSLSWSEAVEEALCYGWIDSTRRTIDHESFMQCFSKRKPKSVWSKINKANVERLRKAGLMTKAGQAAVAIAKENGYWGILDEVEELTIPKDLDKEFRAHKGSKVFFMSLSKSVRKGMLHWVVMAKRPETRQKRIAEIAELAGQHKKPKQF